MKKTLLVIGLALFGLPLASCSQNQPTPEPVSYTIEMSEYAFSPNTMEFQVGQEVTLTLVNLGQLDHELMIGRDVEMHEGRPSGYEMDMFQMSGVVPMVSGDGMLMEHSEDEAAMGQGEMPMGSDESEMDHGDLSGNAPMMVFMPVGAANTTVTFTVTEDMVGTWEMGCFELDGVHYTAGMTGTIIVSP